MKIVTNCHQTMIKSYCWVSFMSVFHSTIRSNQIIKFGWIFHNFLSLLRNKTSKLEAKYLKSPVLVNENVNKPQRLIKGGEKAGDEQCLVYYPKYKKGGAVAKEIKEACHMVIN